MKKTKKVGWARYAVYWYVPNVVFAVLSALRLLQITEYAFVFGYVLFVPFFFSRTDERPPLVLLLVLQPIIEIVFVANAIVVSLLLGSTENALLGIFNVGFFIAAAFFLILRSPRLRRKSSTAEKQ